MMCSQLENHRAVSRDTGNDRILGIHLEFILDFQLDIIARDNVRG